MLSSATVCCILTIDVVPFQVSLSYMVMFSLLFHCLQATVDIHSVVSLKMRLM